jgi:anti-anti-sigma factor
LYFLIDAGEAEMQVRCETDAEVAGAVALGVTGNLGPAGMDTLWEAVTAELSEASPSLLVDLSGVELITSAGIGTLVRLLHRVQSLDGQMVVFGANPRVYEVIDAVMLAGILKLCDTIDEARERLAAM